MPSKHKAQAAQEYRIRNEHSSNCQDNEDDSHITTTRQQQQEEEEEQQQQQHQDDATSNTRTTGQAAETVTVRTTTIPTTKVRRRGITFALHHDTYSLVIRFFNLPVLQHGSLITNTAFRDVPSKISLL